MGIQKIQKGVSIVEIIITIVVLALLGFVGWRVYEARQNKNSDSNQNSQNETSSDSQHFTYTNHDFGYQFKYLGTWNVTEAKNMENQGSAVQYSSTFESPDFKMGEGGVGFVLAEGARLYVSVEPTKLTTPDEYINSNNFLKTAAKNKQTLTLDGQQALSYEVDENDIHNLSTLAVKNDRLYGITMDYANAAARDQYRSEYDLLIKSFKFDSHDIGD